MIPAALTTTAISVLRPASGIDPYDPQPALTTVASGVPAHLSGSPLGRVGQEETVGGEQSEVLRRLDCNPVDLEHTDKVLDEGTGLLYEVTAVIHRQGLGLDHVEADVRLVTGEAVGA